MVLYTYALCIVSAALLAVAAYLSSAPRDRLALLGAIALEIAMCLK